VLCKKLLLPFILFIYKKVTRFVRGMLRTRVVILKHRQTKHCSEQIEGIRHKTVEGAQCRVMTFSKTKLHEGFRTFYVYDNSVLYAYICLKIFL
jgi:hypothetical protein